MQIRCHMYFPWFYIVGIRVFVAVRSTVLCQLVALQLLYGPIFVMGAFRSQTIGLHHMSKSYRLYISSIFLKIKPNICRISPKSIRADSDSVQLSDEIQCCCTPLARAVKYCWCHHYSGVSPVHNEQGVSVAWYFVSQRGRNRLQFLIHVEVRPLRSGRPLIFSPALLSPFYP